MNREFITELSLLIKELVVIITPLSIILSIIYQFIYWSMFNVNIFEYLSINDVIVESLKPLVIIFFAALSMYIVYHLEINEVYRIRNETDIDNQQINPKYYWFLIYFTIFLILIISFSIIYKQYELITYVLIVFLFEILNYLSFTIKKFSKQWVLFLSLLIFIIIGVVAFPISSYYQIKELSNYQEVVSSNKEINGKIYLGKASNTYILMDRKTNNIYYYHSNTMLEIKNVKQN